MSRPTCIPHPRSRCTPVSRRGFSLVEMLIALAITATLLTATFVALDASFKAYQKTTEVASTHTVSRLTMHRMLTLIRTGTEFGPHPVNITNDSVIKSDFLEFFSASGQLMRLEYDPNTQRLSLVRIDDVGNEISNVLLENVTQLDEDDNYISPFTLEYHKGTQLFRATIDLTVIPDDNMSLEIEGNNLDVLRLVASAMPRERAY
ncbi:MAG: PulJ/GspJ family protein [Phycisphaerales bacterium]